MVFELEATFVEPARLITHRLEIDGALFTYGQGRLWQQESLEGNLSFTVPVLLDASLNLTAQSEAVECQNTHVSYAALRHQASNGLPQEFGGFAEWDFLVVNLLVQPRHQGFKGPVARIAEGHDLLMQCADEIGLGCILQEGGLYFAFCANINQARFARRTNERVVAVRQRSVLGAQLPGVFEQKGALELEELSILADAEQRHDKVELPLPRRRHTGFARPSECLLRLAYDLDRIRDHCFSRGALDTTDELFGLVVVERDNDGDFTLGSVDASFARQGRHLDLRNCRVNLRRRDLHGLWLNAEGQDALGHRNYNPLRLRPGEAVAFQGLAQLRQHFGDRVGYREGVGAIQVRMLLRLGIRKPENTPNNLLNCGGGAGLLETAPHVGERAIPPFPQLLNGDDDADGALSSLDLVRPRQFVQGAHGNLDLVLRNAEITSEPLAQWLTGIHALRLQQ